MMIRAAAMYVWPGGTSPRLVQPIPRLIVVDSWATTTDFPREIRDLSSTRDGFGSVSLGPPKSICMRQTQQIILATYHPITRAPSLKEQQQPKVNKQYTYMGQLGCDTKKASQSRDKMAKLGMSLANQLVIQDDVVKYSSVLSSWIVAVK